jgi:hypothetical protein
MNAYRDTLFSVTSNAKNPIVGVCVCVQSGSHCACSFLRNSMAVLLTWFHPVEINTFVLKSTDERKPRIRVCSALCLRLGLARIIRRRLS